MSKKIVALVLFVAMMLMMVPASNAADGAVTHVVGFDKDSTRAYWFDSYSGETLSPVSGSTNTFTIGASGVTMKISSTAFLTDLTGAGASGVTTSDKAGSTGNVTIDLSGKLADLEAYYYTQMGALVPKAKAVKIPYYVTKITESSPPSPSPVVTTYGYADANSLALVNGAPASSDMLVNAAGGYLYYLTVLLTEENSSQVFDISVSGGSVAKVTVNWNNTASSSSSANFITLKPVSKSGDQKNNFAVTAVAPKKDTNGILYYDIAKRSSDDNTAIGTIPAIKTVNAIILEYYDFISAGNGQVDISADGVVTAAPGAGDYTLKSGKTQGAFEAAIVANAGAIAAQDKAGNFMVAKFQAINNDGTIKPFGTTVSATPAAGHKFTTVGVDTLLKGTDSYALVGGTRTYFLDNDGCFTLNMQGIQSWTAWGTGSNLVYYMDKAATITFSFKSGNATAENAVYDILFRNVDRTKSGITVLDSEVTLEVDEVYTIQYVVDNADALNKSVSWKSVNPSIVKVSDAGTGKITAVALGDTLLFVEDAAGNTHVVRVFVVEDKTVTPDDPTDPTDPVDGVAYVVTASSLNVRKGPGTSYGKVGSLKRGTEVIVIEEVRDGAWMQIEAVDGFKAADMYYVSGKYLSKSN